MVFTRASARLAQKPSWGRVLGASKEIHHPTSPTASQYPLSCRGPGSVARGRTAGPSPRECWSRIQAPLRHLEIWGWVEESQGWGSALLSQSCFWGGDGDRILPHHGSLTWGSPHVLLPGVLDGEQDASS